MFPYNLILTSVSTVGMVILDQILERTKQLLFFSMYIIFPQYCRIVFFRIAYGGEDFVMSVMQLLFESP